MIRCVHCDAPTQIPSGPIVIWDGLCIDCDQRKGQILQSCCGNIGFDIVDRDSGESICSACGAV